MIPTLECPRRSCAILGMNPACEHVCRVRVAQVMKAHAGQGGGLREQSDELMCQAVWLQRAAVLLSDNEQVVVVPDPGRVE